MGAADRNGGYTHQQGTSSAVDLSFDEIAREFAGGVSRRKALRLLGSALLGGVLASIPGVAWARADRNQSYRSCPGGIERCGRVCCEVITRTCVPGGGGNPPQCVCEAGKTECGGSTHRCCFSREVCVNGECTCAPEYTVCGNQATDEFECCREGQFCCPNSPPGVSNCCDTPCCNGVCCTPGKTCVNGECTCTQGTECGDFCCTGQDECCDGFCCRAEFGEFCADGLCQTPACDPCFEQGLGCQCTPGQGCECL
jgi:hypothetical protein